MTRRRSPDADRRVGAGRGSTAVTPALSHPWETRRSRRATHPRDEGAAVVLSLLLGGALVLIVLVGSVVTDLLAARQRAAAAADLGALAGAPAAERSVEDACLSAAWVVHANGATLRRCDVVGGDVLVTVSASPRGSFSRWLGALVGGVPEPTVSSHAGMR